MESNNELFMGTTSQVNCLKVEILFERLFKELLNIVHGHSRGRDQYDGPEEKFSIKTMDCFVDLAQKYNFSSNKLT